MPNHKRKVSLRDQLTIATNKIHIMERAYQDALAKIAELEEQIRNKDTSAAKES